MKHVHPIMIYLSVEDRKELRARARARGCSRSREISHLLHDHRGEDPRVTAARYFAEAKEHERLGREARARASIERTRYNQIVSDQRVRERLTLAAMKVGATITFPVTEPPKPPQS